MVSSMISIIRILMPVILAVFCYGFAVADDDEARAQRLMNAFGGKVPSNPAIIANFSNTKLTDDGLKEVAGLKHLVWLMIGETKITDAGLSELTALTKLQSLTLDKNQISDAGMKHVGKLAGLQTL